MCELEEITRECGAATPGISRVYGVDLDDVVSVPLPNANYTITGNITLKTGKFFKDIPFVEGEGGFTDDIADAVGGGFKKSLPIKLSKYSPQTNKWINSMIGARILVIIADNNDQMIVVGNKIAGMRLEKATGATGQKQGDKNGWDLNLVTEGVKPSYFYTGAVPLGTVVADYDTTLTFGSSNIASAAGVSAAIEGGTTNSILKVRFKAINPHTGLPIDATVLKSSVEQVVLTYAAEYANQPLEITDRDGVVHDTTFLAAFGDLIL